MKIRYFVKLHIFTYAMPLPEIHMAWRKINPSLEDLQF